MGPQKRAHRTARPPPSTPEPKHAGPSGPVVLRVAALIVAGALAACGGNTATSDTPSGGLTAHPGGREAATPAAGQDGGNSMLTGVSLEVHAAPG